MIRLDETQAKIKASLKWLKARRSDALTESAGIKARLLFHRSSSPEFDRQRYHEALAQIELFDTLIAQHGKKLSEHQKQKQIEVSDPQALIYAVPRPDVLDVKELEGATFSDPFLTSQIERRATSLEAWHYRCLGMHNRRPSRRYEGFHDSR